MNSPKLVPSFFVDITLDPTSAHPNLDVYAGRKVYCRDTKVTDVPTALNVFSEDRFSSGQLNWEVKVREDSIFSKEKQSWYVIVATDIATLTRALNPY